jgi:hypothetical protein
MWSERIKSNNVCYFQCTPVADIDDDYNEWSTLTFLIEKQWKLHQPDIMLVRKMPFFYILNKSILMQYYYLNKFQGHRFVHVKLSFHASFNLFVEVMLFLW